MTWKVAKTRDGYLIAEKMSNDAPENDIYELVEMFIEHIVMLPHPAWDYIRAEFWAESGSIYMYPADSQKDIRIEVGMAHVISLVLLEEADKLSDAEISDSEFEETLNVTLKRLSAVLADAIHKSNVCQRLGRPNMRILCFDAEETEPFYEISCNETSA